MTGRLEQLRIAARLRRALAAQARREAADPEARAAERTRRLDALRRHAVARSPLYRERHRGLEGAPLCELPTITKADVVERFDEVVTDRTLDLGQLRQVVAGGDPAARAGGRYRVAATSGSSGRPGLLPFDEAEWVGLLANAARARTVAGRPRVEGRLRSAKVGSPSPWHLSAQLSTTLQDPRKPSLALDASRDVDELAHELDRWQPQLLTAYPSVLGALADLQLAGRMAIAPVQVFTGGERLTPAVRERSRAAWGVELHDQYATTEAGFVAIECPAHAGLHVLDDHVLVEVVDASGAPVEPGGTGTRVLVTVLGSRTLPLVRYELEDVATVAAGPCPCGRSGPRLAQVAGAGRDLLVLPASAGGEVAIHPVVLTAVLDAADVRAWQAVLHPAGLQVAVEAPGPRFSAVEVGRRISRALEAAGAAVAEVEVRVVAELDRGPSGKASLVVSRDAPRR